MFLEAAHIKHKEMLCAILALYGGVLWQNKSELY